VITGGTVSHDIFADPKTRIIYTSSNRNHWEAYTINLLFDYAMLHPDEEFQVLYLHSKGVRYNGRNQNVTDWTAYMTHFTVDQNELCRQALLEYDAVGVNLANDPCLHYSGNFWWSTSAHIRTLHTCNTKIYHSPEFWITSSLGNYLTLWQNDLDMYKKPYPEHCYVGKPILPKSILVKIS